MPAKQDPTSESKRKQPAQARESENSLAFEIEAYRLQLKQLFPTETHVRTLQRKRPFPTHEIVEALIKQDLKPFVWYLYYLKDINEGNDDGDTALHLAARYSQPELIKLLLRFDAISSPNKKGETPLSIARRANTQACIQLLSEAEPNHPQGIQPVNTKKLLSLIHSGRDDLENFKLCETLYPKQMPNYFLNEAIRFGSFNIFNYLLLEKNLQCEHRSEKGRTPLIMAAAAGYQDIVKALIEKGAKVNARDASNNTAFALAAEQLNAGICEILVLHGAKVKTVNFKQEKPLDMAFESLLLESLTIPSPGATMENAVQAFVDASTAFKQIETLYHEQLQKISITPPHLMPGTLEHKAYLPQRQAPNPAEACIPLDGEESDKQDNQVAPAITFSFKEASGTRISPVESTTNTDSANNTVVNTRQERASQI